MLDTPSAFRIVPEQREAAADNDVIPLAVALAFVRRQKAVISTCLLAALSLACLYIIIAPNFMHALTIHPTIFPAGASLG